MTGESNYWSTFSKFRHDRWQYSTFLFSLVVLELSGWPITSQSKQSANKTNKLASGKLAACWVVRVCDHNQHFLVRQKMWVSLLPFPRCLQRLAKLPATSSVNHLCSLDTRSKSVAGNCGKRADLVGQFGSNLKCIYAGVFPLQITPSGYFSPTLRN